MKLTACGSHRGAAAEAQRLADDLVDARGERGELLSQGEHTKNPVQNELNQAVGSMVSLVGAVIGHEWLAVGEGVGGRNAFPPHPPPTPPNPDIWSRF